MEAPGWGEARVACSAAAGAPRAAERVRAHRSPSGGRGGSVPGGGGDPVQARGRHDVEHLPVLAAEAQVTDLLGDRQIQQSMPIGGEHLDPGPARAPDAAFTIHTDYVGSICGDVGFDPYVICVPLLAHI